MTTLTTVLNRAGVTVPDDLIADLVVPVLSGPQRQGDVLVVPRPACSPVELDQMDEVPAKGANVVVGEATGNAHLIQPDPGSRVLFKRSAPADGSVLLGVLHVPEGAAAWLIHTDEHGANGIGPGSYVLHGKREQVDEIRRVAD